MDSRRNSRFSRRGTAVATVAVSSSLLIGFAALAIDMGVFYNTRIEAQRSADAAALAGIWALLGDERVSGPAGIELSTENARLSANHMAGLNPVFRQSPQVDLNAANDMGGDIVLGRLNDFYDRSEPLSTNGPPDEYNAVSVLVRRDDVRNGPIPFFFGQIFGFRTKNMSARATAAVRTNVAGYRVTATSSNAKLMPFAVHVDAWNDMLAGVLTMGDDFAYDPETKTVSSGSDGVYELNMYPGGGSGQQPFEHESSSGQLPPGNFGTVDIGNQNNSTADLRRQIREGISAEDLAYYDGELRFDNEGKLYLNGDTGLSAAIKSDLETIIGQPRSILLFTEVAGPGNNAAYTIVGFAGIRIMEVELTGSMSSKKVVIQPAVVIDKTAIFEDSAPLSHFIYSPPTLVR